MTSTTSSVDLPQPYQPPVAEEISAEQKIEVNIVEDYIPVLEEAHEPLSEKKIIPLNTTKEIVGELLDHVKHNPEYRRVLEEELKQFSSITIDQFITMVESDLLNEKPPTKAAVSIEFQQHLQNHISTSYKNPIGVKKNPIAKNIVIHSLGVGLKYAGHGIFHLLKGMYFCAKVSAIILCILPSPVIPVAVFMLRAYLLL